jgi:hypothetical protein
MKQEHIKQKKKRKKIENRISYSNREKNKDEE